MATKKRRVTKVARREQNRTKNGATKKSPEATTKRLVVGVGEPWTTSDVNIRIGDAEQIEAKSRMLFRLVSLTALLLVVFITYGFWNHDSKIIDHAFELVKNTLYAALGWAIGASRMPKRT